MIVKGNGTVRLLIEGDFNFSGNAKIITQDGAKVMFYFKNDNDIDIGATMEGSVFFYAPKSKVKLSGNPTITGAIYGKEIEVGNINPNKIKYEDWVSELLLDTVGRTGMVMYTWFN